MSGRDGVLQCSVKLEIGGGGGAARSPQQRAALTIPMANSEKLGEHILLQPRLPRLSSPVASKTLF